MASVVKNSGIISIPGTEEETIVLICKEVFTERETKVPTDSGAETESAHKGEVTANREKDNVEVASTLPKNNASEEEQDKVSENEQIRNLYLAYDKTLKELREMEEGKLPPFNKSNKMMESDDDDDDER